MMKRLGKILLIIVLSLCFIPTVHGQANTLGDLKQELADLKAQKAANDSAKNKTQAEINQQNANIANANAAIQQAETDIQIAKNKIEESNKKIDKTVADSKELLVFYQIMQGEDDFLQYISGASSMTDLVMRSEAVSQIVDYNQDNLTELEKEIEENNQLQIDLKNKEEDLKIKIKEYEKSLSGLKNDLSSLVEVSLDINSQIKAQQELINYYQEIGCKDNQLLSECVSIDGSARWLKPVERGYISSDFGYRSFYLNGAPYSDFHNAVDIAGNSGGTNVYSAANGTVAAVIRKASCGGNQIYIHVRVQGIAYTLTYAHLMDVYVGVGDKVTASTVIGTVGGGGKTLKSNGGWDTCSTGYHLHFGVAKGFYLGGGAEGYSSYNKYVSQSIVPPGMPAYGGWFYSRY